MKKTERLIIRLSKNEVTFIKNSAQVYADGNVSDWLRYCAMNYSPKYLPKKMKAPKEEADKTDKTEY